MAVKRVNEIPISESNPLGGGGVDEATLKRISDLEELVKKQSELLDIVDTDLNALVGGSDE